MASLEKNIHNRAYRFSDKSSEKTVLFVMMHIQETKPPSQVFPPVWMSDQFVEGVFISLSNEL